MPLHPSLRRLALCIAWPLLGFSFTACVGQISSTPQNLSSAVAAFVADPNIATPTWFEKLEPLIMAASSSDIGNQLPLLVTLSISPNPDVRYRDMLLLETFISRPTQDHSSIDTSVAELLFPYLDRLTPRLADSSPDVRGNARLIIGFFAMLHPRSPEILHLVLDLLRNPKSSAEPSDVGGRGNPGYGWAYGPELLNIILLTDASPLPNAESGMTDWQDSPEVQTAIIEFVQRKELTSASRVGTIKALAEANVQNPAVNAALLPWLTSSDVLTQEALLIHLNQLTLSPEDYTRTRVTVRNLAADQETPATLRSAALALLPCWKNDRHSGPCPSSP